MKILVPVKRVIDPYVRIRIKDDRQGVETRNVKMCMNPFDEIAVEQAIRFKEQSLADKISLVTIGEVICKETLTAGLALGADAAYLIETDQQLEPLSIAKVLQHMVKKLEIDLVIMGKQSIDGDNSQTGQMLASLLDWPQATFASTIDLTASKALVTREVDSGLEQLEMCLPAVITTDLRLNEPRYASLPNIMKAKQKPLEIVGLDSLVLQLQQHLEVLNVTPPPPRSAGTIFDSVDELVNQLVNVDKLV